MSRWPDGDVQDASCGHPFPNSLGTRKRQNEEGVQRQHLLFQWVWDMESFNIRRHIALGLLLAAVVAFTTLGQLLRRESEEIGYGMHTLRGDGRELALVAEAGFDSVVQLFNWREIARWRGLYNWEHPDAVVRGAEHHGLKLVVRLDQQPQWARARPADNGPPDDLADYGQFVYDVASRYKGRIKAYIIWNEPNLAREWGGQRPDPAAYVEMLKLAYLRIKEADPNALVVSAGLAPTNSQNEEALDDRIFLRAVYEAGAKEYFDVLGAHVYGFAYPPGDPHGAHQGLNVARVQDLREIMVDHGDEHKPVWATELGWTVAQNEEQAWQRVSPEEQARYLVGAFRRALADWPWLELVTVWNLGYGLPPENEQAGYGLVGPEGEVRPAYIALRDMPKRGILASVREVRDGYRQVLINQWQDERPRVLEEDVVIHLGDNRWPTPWVPLYQGQLPSTVWRGEFYVLHPGEASWTLHIDVMQNNERNNYVMVNGRPVEPLYLPVEDYSRSWVSISCHVPADYLRVGLNELTVVVGKQIPARHSSGTYEDLQLRDVFLTRE